MKVNKAIFRDYDIRGIVNEDLNDEFAFCFGRAFGTWLMRRGTREIIVGYDARESSRSYFENCVNGLLSTGLNVTRAGLMTSPMMYWARKYYKIDGGLNITASHNPPEFNGFKPASGEGCLYGQDLQDLAELMISEDFEKGTGTVSDKEVIDDYAADIASRIKLKKPLKVIVDCGNATAGPYAPKILEAIGVEVKPLFCDIDFTQPNHPPDPVDPRAYPQITEMIKKEKGFDMGILFDGDADRIGVVDKDGNVIRGDQITALCARKILADKPGSLILFELQCSKSGIDDVVNNGGKTKLVRVGHSYVEEALRLEKAELAGETSGHIFFSDRWYGFDDAIYAACRLLEYVSETGKSLEDLVSSLPSYVSTPQTRIFAPDDRKFQIIEELKGYFKTKGEKVVEIDGVRLEWSDGWTVIRASNTQPQLTLRAEATDQQRLEEIKKMVEEALAHFEKDGVKLEWGKVH